MENPGRIYEMLMSVAFFDSRDVCIGRFFTEDYYCSAYADNLILSHLIFCALKALSQQNATQRSKFCEFMEQFNLDCTGNELDLFLEKIGSEINWID